MDQISNETDKSNTRDLLVFGVGLFISIFVPVIYFAAARHFYYEQPFLDNLSFKPNDVPGYVEIDSEVHPVGIHYFGDYLLPHYWARPGNPWLDNPIVTYPPLALEVFRPFRIFPYKVGLILYQLTITVCMVFPIFHSLRKLGTSYLVFGVGILGLLSGPVINALDRGNVFGLLPVMYYFAGIYVIRRSWLKASIFIAIAASIKYVPIALSLLFLAQRKYVWFLFTCLLTGGGLVVMSALYPGPLKSTLTGIYNGAVPFLSSSPSEFLCYNTSYVASLAQISNLLGLGELTNFVLLHSSMLAISVSGIVTILIVVSKLPTWIKVVLAMSLTTLLPTKIFSYSFVWVIAAVGIILFSSSYNLKNMQRDHLNYWEQRDFKFQKVALGLLVPILVPWPIAIPATSVLGCRTSIIGIIGLVMTTILIAFAIKEALAMQKEYSLMKH